MHTAPRVLGVLGFLVFFGCADNASAVGTSGGRCYGNDTCNQGLTCQDGLCVTAPDVDAGINDASAADASPVDGSAAGWHLYDDFSSSSLDENLWLESHDPAYFAGVPFSIDAGVLKIDGETSMDRQMIGVRSRVAQPISQLRLSWQRDAAGTQSYNIRFCFSETVNFLAEACLTFGCWSGGCPYFDGAVPDNGQLRFAFESGQLVMYRDGVNAASRASELQPRYFAIKLNIGQAPLDYVIGRVDDVEICRSGCQ